jgi:cytochrome c biogenesis protein CcdA
MVDRASVVRVGFFVIIGLYLLLVAAGIVASTIGPPALAFRSTTQKLESLLVMVFGALLIIYRPEGTALLRAFRAKMGSKAEVQGRAGSLGTGVFLVLMGLVQVLMYWTN